MGNLNRMIVHGAREYSHFPQHRCVFVMRILLVVLLPLTLSAATPAFSIEHVLSAPFPENLTVSSRADAVAWIQNATGIRNIWVAQSPDYRAHTITSFTEDDG